jgi:polyferredoxin
MYTSSCYFLVLTQSCFTVTLHEQECDDKATAERATAAQHENAMDECVQVCGNHTILLYTIACSV